MSCGVGSDLGFLWLWRRPAAAAVIQPRALEQLPYAMAVALKRPKKKECNTHTHFLENMILQY